MPPPDALLTAHERPETLLVTPFERNEHLACVVKRRPGQQNLIAERQGHDSSTNINLQPDTVLLQESLAPSALFKDEIEIHRTAVEHQPC